MANKCAITMTVNGKQYHSEVEPRMLLVHYLRDQLDLTGTHIGCDTSQCGACTVLLNGDSVKACTVDWPPKEACTRSRRGSGRSMACSAASALQA